MRILMCSFDGPEPRTNGIRLAVGALLDELRRSHEIRHIAYRQPDQRGLRDDVEMRFVDLPERSIRGAALLHATLRRRPWGADRLAAGLERVLAEEINAFKPDVVHVNRWLLARLGRSLTDVPSLLSAFDAWHLNVDASVLVASAVRRPLLRAEARRVRRFEAEEFAHFGRVVVVTKQDKAQLEELNPQLCLSVIPNGVDTEFFSGGAAAAVPGRVVFTGNMGYPPNIVAADFLAKQLLPRIRATRSEAHLAIVGREPDPSVVALASLDGVEVTGEVDDVRPWLRSAQVFVCPMLSGTGIKNKLLEAMATELPCVVTPLALQGLEVIAGTHVAIGETAEELSNQAIAIMGNAAAATSLGRAARAYVINHHSWSSAAQRYARIYDELRAKGSPGSDSVRKKACFSD